MHNSFRKEKQVTTQQYLGLAALVAAAVLIASFALARAQVVDTSSTTASSTASSTDSTATTTASTTAPVISGISVVASTTSATISWTTNQAANSQVAYGTTSAYGASTTLDTALVTSHSVNLFGLASGTMYHFNIMTSNASGTMATSGDMMFMTAVASSTGTSTATTTPGTGTSTPGTATSTWQEIEDIKDEIHDLKTRLFNLEDRLQDLIDSLGGTSTPTTTPPTTGTGMITPTNTTMIGGSAIDFNGRGFGHEESVLVTRGGTTVTTAHADGGGNFTTGSLSTPTTPGTYTYTFTGQNSGIVGTATVTIQ